MHRAFDSLCGSHFRLSADEFGDLVFAVMLTSVMSKSEKNHCNNAYEDEKPGKHNDSPKQKSLEAVELRSVGHNHLRTHN